MMVLMKRQEPNIIEQGTKVETIPWTMKYKEMTWVSHVMHTDVNLWMTTEVRPNSGLSGEVKFENLAEQDRVKSSKRWKCRGKASACSGLEMGEDKADDYIELSKKKKNLRYL